MRFGLLGDVHAEDARVEAALGLFAAQRVDAVLCVGDVVDGRGDANRTVALLAGAGALAVRGNHERWLLRGEMRHLPEAHMREHLDAASRAWLAALPSTRGVPTPLGELLLCHGIGDDDLAQLLPDSEGYALTALDGLHALLAADRVRLIVGGHTHRRMVRRFGDVVFINPGTLREGDDPCVAVLDTARELVRFFDFDGRVTLTMADEFPLEPHVFPV